MDSNGGQVVKLAKITSFGECNILQSCSGVSETFWSVVPIFTIVYFRVWTPSLGMLLRI